MASSMAVAPATNQSRTGTVSSALATPHNNGTFTGDHRRAKSLKKPCTARASPCVVGCSLANALHLRRRRLCGGGTTASPASGPVSTLSVSDPLTTSIQLCQIELQCTENLHGIICSRDARLTNTHAFHPVPPGHTAGRNANEHASGLNRFERRLASAVSINVSILVEASTRPVFKMGWL